jgi:glutamate N-acetyltransferase/amino-acid N-acetyltransferase
MTTVRVSVAARAAESAVLEALHSDLPAVERRAAMPDGFRAAGGIAGIKASGRPDIALIVRRGKETFPAAAVFTPNRFAAAPVRLSKSNLLATEPGGDGGFGYADAVICTSGCANAATGAAGDDDQAAVGRLVHEATGSHEDRVLHLSTGLIGTRLPLDRVGPAISALSHALASTDDALLAAAESFRTTDSVAKVATTTVELARGATVRVTGIAKGVGMIHPTMATMLSVLVTDAGASPKLLWEVLRQATARTWNQLSVDGDTSTNDTVFLLGSGAAGVIVDERTRAAFAGAVEAVARDLARQQASDGEGATALITCQVSGAADDAEARAVARIVVSSSLVKAAVHGRDPNWGRIAGAAGNATLARSAVLEAGGLTAAEAQERGGQAARVDPDKLRVAIAGHLVYDGPSGGPIAFDREAARRDMAGKEVLLRLDLGLGDGRGEAFGCDLTEAYVIENSEYTT